MKIKYELNKKKISKNVLNESLNSILINNKGHFLNLGLSNSKYNGFFIKSDEGYFKILEEIFIPHPVEEINYKFCKVERKKKTYERFFIPENYNSLIYENDVLTNLDIVLDVRQMNDFSKNNRNYRVEKIKDKIIVTFDKYSKPIYLIFNCFNNENFEIDNSWLEYYYNYDLKRNSPPYNWFVYKAFKIKSKSLIISCGFDKGKLIKENDFILKNKNKLKNKKLLEDSEFNKNIKDKEISFSYISSCNSLNFISSEDGIYAGIPWFIQNWTRDEMISLKAFSFLNRKFAKKIIINRIKLIHKSGRLPNIVPECGLDSADSIGWLFKRIEDFRSYFTKKEIGEISKILILTCDSLIENYYKNDFFINYGLETWMDTGGKYDERAGFRIEIQALFLKILDVTFKLSKNVKYKKMYNELKKNVKKSFFKENYLYDGLNDGIIRPNLFIAYYIVPDLLNKKEWESCFDMALRKLWLKWGGVSTIDFENSLFNAEYTGEDNKSYHRGDSWYWLNNLVGICLNRLNWEKYSLYIEKIINASKNDILWNGALGSSSELSSAKFQTSSGCLNQSWSNAMFIELCREYFGNHK